jgi:enterochelin esterase-like enzyme
LKSSTLALLNRIFFLIFIGLALPACTTHVNAGEFLVVSPTPISIPGQALPSSTHVPLPANPTVIPPLPSPSIIPTKLPTSTPLPCWSQAGTDLEGSLRADLLPLPLDYRIHLPPCYDHQPERHYPVLYLIHGKNYNNDQWDRLGASQLSDTLAASGRTSPFIIVMPRDRSWSSPIEDKFGQVVIDTLIPWVDTHFRTLPTRQFRAIGGLSRGAAWAVHLGFSHWQLFGAVAAHSLPVFWEDTGEIRGWLDDIPSQMLLRIYMDTGDQDYLIRSTLWFEKVLTQKAIPHEWHLYTGYHNEKYWKTHVEEYLLWYAKDW